jgi:hypothetical protein
MTEMSEANLLDGESNGEELSAGGWLIDSLRQIQSYHARLKDWADLQGQLHEILFIYGAFSREIERLFVFHEDPEPSTIGMHWRPISQQVAILLDWASAPRSVDESEPFARLEDRLVGPNWAVEIFVTSSRLDDLVRPEEPARLFGLPHAQPPSRAVYVDINELLDAASEFYDTVERAMYLSDHRLRETVTELLGFSSSVLPRLEEK